MDNHKKPTCANCAFSEPLFTRGETYHTISPHGNEIERVHEHTVLTCHLNPPLGDTWSRVLEDDWCSWYKE